MLQRKLALCYRCRDLLRKAGYTLTAATSGEAQKCDNCRKKGLAEPYYVTKEKK